MTTHTPADPDLRAFVAAIRAAPDDHTPQLAFADFLQERGDDDRAELIRGQIQLTSYPWVNYPCPNCGDTGRMDQWRCKWCPARQSLRARVRELEARLSRWPCRVCAGYTARSGTRHCPECRGSGDVLKVRDPGSAHWEVDASPAPLPLRWLGGYPSFATLPRLVDAVDDDPAPVHGECRNWAPTPRLLALAALPPWGVPLEGVLVADREPYWNGAGWCWYDAGRNLPTVGIPESADLPTPVFAAVSGCVPGKSGGVRWKPFGTPELARLALGRAVVAFGRGGSP